MEAYLDNSATTMAYPEEMCRKRMAQRMRCDLRFDPRLLPIKLDQFPETLTAHCTTGTIRKQPRTVRLADQMISSILHISCQCLPCDIPKWNDPFFMDIRTDHILHLKIQIRDF